MKAKAGARTARPSKFRARHETVDGIRFDSAREARHFAQLRLLERSGQIANLRRQVRYNLTVNGERITALVVDFEFTDLSVDPPRLRLQDMKGYINPKHPATGLWKLKHKLLRAIHGLEVEIVK